MVDEQTIRQRIQQLQDERNRVAEGLEHMAAEMERGARLLHSYDGAIGELSALLQAAPVEDAEAAA